MSMWTVVWAVLVIGAMVGLGVMATRVNRRSSDGTTPRDTKGPIDQVGSGGSAYQEKNYGRFPGGEGGDSGGGY